MNIILKNLKIAKFLSEETLAFTATIYVDGKKVGEVSNDGHGGPNRYHFDAFDGKKGYEIEQELQAWANTQPPNKEFPFLKVDLDMIVARLMDKEEESKQLRRWCKKETLFMLEGDAEGQWRTVKAPYSDRVQAFLDNKYGSKVVRIANKEFA